MAVVLVVVCDFVGGMDCSSISDKSVGGGLDIE